MYVCQDDYSKTMNGIKSKLSHCLDVGFQKFNGNSSNHIYWESYVYEQHQEAH